MSHDKKIAIITGVAGQDGSYLSEYLLDNYYQVIGITRRKSVELGLQNIKHILNHPSFDLIYGDITDPSFIYKLIYDHQPDEWYNLAAMSSVGHSFQEPILTFKVNAEAVIMQLDAIVKFSPNTKFYQASTSELWGASECPKDGFDEKSSFYPRSPYGVSKLAAFSAVKNYREAYNLFACNGILCNHSSIRRGEEFATRKISKGIASVKLGLQKKLKMGNLEAFRDEGAASDYVKTMHLLLQNKIPSDYVVATGEGATIREMFEYVCNLANLRLEDIYEQDSRFMRPSDIQYLKGNSSKIRKELGWKPTKTWKMLLEEMYLNDLNSLK